jgi:copper homeostasis protein (lipoprotein)
MRTTPATRRRLRGAYLAAACAAVLAATSGCASGPAATAPEAPAADPATAVSGGGTARATGLVRGTATYRERIALPPEAVLEVVLEDVSLADAPARELGSVRRTDPGSPPFSFEIAYDPAEIDQRRSYAVRADVRVDGRLLFTTDTVYPVLTRGAGTDVELLLRATPAWPEASATALLGKLPARFEGELPCADCPGIHYRLDLLEDRVFFLRMTYLGRGADAIFDLIGTWTLSSDDSRLVLFGGTEAPIFFRLVDRDTVRKLDIEGREIESDLDYDLRRREGLEPLEPRLTMRGMYRYLADAALFEECLSGRRFPVAMEAEHAALERAYLEAQEQPGEPLLVSLQGLIAQRPAVDGDGTVPTLVPERFIGVWPGETCGSRMTIAELENTYWKLTRLGDQPVIVGERQREPHIVLHQQDGRVAAFGGCNRMTGGYTVDGSAIEFSQMASTMMACPNGMNTEQGLAAALGRARSFRLIGQHLDLFDEAGELVARFEARPLD